ncbi:MAG: hypothetical protein GY861_11945, partial [bacterium]|nr:hypothetical protein [bacterium]
MKKNFVKAVIMAIVVVFCAFNVNAEGITDAGYVTTSNDESVKVECLGKDADFSHTLVALVTEPDEEVREVECFDSGNVGAIVDLGDLPLGTVIEFKLLVTEGCQFDKKAYRRAIKSRFDSEWREVRKELHAEWKALKRKHRGKKNAKKRHNANREYQINKKALKKGLRNEIKRSLDRSEFVTCTERTYYSDSYRNEDLFDHILVTGQEFSFEDHWNGGDQDFNDCNFKIIGDVIVVGTGELEFVADQIIEGSNNEDPPTEDPPVEDPEDPP